MTISIFNRIFTRQIGGAPPPPLIGSDAAPVNVLADVQLDNGLATPSRTSRETPIGAVVVGLSGPSAIDVEVYLGDENANVWLLAGRATAGAGSLTRFPGLSATAADLTAVYVRPLATLGAANGTYTFGVAIDTACRPVLVDNAIALVENTLVRVDGVMPADATRYEPVRSNGDVIKNAPGTLWLIYGNANTGANRWLMTFDSAVVPPDTTPPADFVQIPLAQKGEAGIYIVGGYSVGISWASSTTPDVLTRSPDLDLLVRARFT